MKTIAKNLIFILSIIFITVSCSNNDDDSNNNNNSKTHVVKYEVTGTFSSELGARFTPASGGAAVEEVITTLPWTKEFTTDPGTKSVGLFVFGRGDAGQTVVVKIYVDGVVKGQSTATSSSGTITSNVSHSF